MASNISNLGDTAMTIIEGINQYLNYYKVVIPNECVDDFFNEKKSQDFICINSSLKTACNIIFDENVSIGSFTYSVKLIRVHERELTVFIFTG